MTPGSGSLATKCDVLKAVRDEIAQLPPELRDALALDPVEPEVSVSPEGDWVVPVTTGGSTAMAKSHVLHRVLSDVQARVEQRVNAFVSLVLAA